MSSIVSWKHHPTGWKAFNELGSRCHEAGPLDEKSRRLGCQHSGDAGRDTRFYLDSRQGRGQVGRDLGLIGYDQNERQRQIDDRGNQESACVRS